VISVISGEFFVQSQITAIAAITRDHGDHGDSNDLP